MKAFTSDLTLEQKVGQLFMVGFSGTRVTPEVRHLFRDLCFGGVVLFKRNIEDAEQTRALIHELKDISLKATGLPLFVAVDEEGGPIVRLPKGSPVFPGPMALAATRSIANARTVAKTTAQELRSLGFNFNLAPVVDVLREPANLVIGPRSFGGDPKSVGAFAGAYIRALQSQGVLAAAKHFPGLGSSTRDPHDTLPVIPTSRKELKEKDLLPFGEAIRSGVSSVMVSNAYYSRLDREFGLPACFSRRIVTGLLRRGLGFNGLVLSDDLDMDAVARRYSMSEAARRTFSAGCDLLLVCQRTTSQALARKSLFYAFRSGDLPLTRLEGSLSRIQEAKVRLSPSSSPGSTVSTARLQQITEQGITLAKCERPLVPLPRKLGGPLGLIVPRLSELVPVGDDAEPIRILHPLLSSRYEVKALGVGIKPGTEDFQKAAALARECPLVLFTSYDAHRNRRQPRLVRLLVRNNPNVVVAALRNPYDYLLFSEVPCYLAAYSFRRPALEALAKVLLGEIKPRGTLPVTIPGL